MIYIIISLRTVTADIIHRHRSRSIQFQRKAQLLVCRLIDRCHRIACMITEGCHEHIQLLDLHDFTVDSLHLLHRYFFLPRIQHDIPEIIHIQIKYMIGTSQHDSVRVRINTPTCIHDRRKICHAHDVTVPVAHAQKARGKYSICHCILRIDIVVIARNNVFLFCHALLDAVYLRMIPLAQIPLIKSNTNLFLQTECLQQPLYLAHRMSDICCVSHTRIIICTVVCLMDRIPVFMYRDPVKELPTILEQIYIPVNICQRSSR